MSRRRLLLPLVLALLAASPARAQVEIEYTGPELVAGPWKLDNFPYFTVTPNDGFMLIGRVQYGQAADFLDRVSMARRIALEGGVSSSGSRFAALRLDAPRLAPGWRLASEFRLGRANRFGYYSLGNDTEPTGNGAELADRVRRSRTLARVEVTRTIAGPVHLAVAGGAWSTTWEALEGPSRFQAEWGQRLEEEDAWGRVALVVDLRDNEYETRRGVLLEGGVLGGTGGEGEGYGGWYALASGFAQPFFGTVLAARVGGRSLDREAPLSARFELPTWERDVPVLGGPGSHRAFPVGRFAGHDALFGSLEVRQQIVDGGDYGGIYGLAFLDVGRVFEDTPGGDGSLRLTTDGLKVGGGLGIGLRILRANVLSITAARGPEGTRWMVGSGWMF